MKCTSALHIPLAILVMGLSWIGPASAELPTQLLVDLRDDTTDEDEAALESALNVELRLNSPQAADERLFIADVDRSRLSELVNQLKDDPRVEFAEPNFIYSLPEGENTALERWASGTSGAPSPQRGPLPNDPLWSRQWSFRMINVPEAWSKANGSGVVVAVIDTGVAFEDYKKFKVVEDLDPNRFVEGYNFITDTSHANDDHGHGTHVAGTIAQTTFNAKGVAGIAHNAKIMPLKVLSKRGFGTAGDIADAIRFAADEGAHVMNLSLGGGPRSSVMASAVNYARQKGVLVICAAGNNGRRRVEYPAAYPGAFAVSSVGPTKKLAFYSSYGPEIAVAAPGGDKNVGDEEGGILQNTIITNRPELTGLYLSYQGTSMATPHVAGVAALIISAGVTRADRVEDILKNTAEDLGASGHDDQFGHGLINAAAAVRTAHIEAHASAYTGWSFLSWLAILTTFSLRLGRRTLMLILTPGSLLGAVVASVSLGGVFGLFGWLIPAWTLVGALWASAFPLIALTIFFLGFKKPRSLLIGLSIGWAAHLAAAAIIGTIDVGGIPGTAGIADRIWLVSQAILLSILAFRTIRITLKSK